MFYVLQNESTAALRRVPILLTDAATGTTAQTGVGLSTIFPYVNINGGAFAGGAGTVAEAGYGQYYYEFDPSEIATLGLAGIHITASGCRNYDAIAQVAAFNVYSGGGVGISAYDVWDFDISGISTAGSAGTQLNTAASGGAGLTAGDVWSYVIPGPADPAETVLANINTNASNASSNTGSSAIRDAVWDTDVSYLYPSGQAGGALYAAAFGATDAGNQVWNYDISAITTAGTAGSQLNQAASGGAGLTAGDVTNAVWDVATSSYTNSGTFGHNILRSDNAGVAGNVSLWTGGAFSGVFADTYRIDEDYNAAIALKDILTGIGASITGNITGNLTGSVGYIVDDVTLSAGTQASIANSVWSTDISGYTSPSAGYDLSNASSGAGITAGDVWNYTLLSSSQSADTTIGNIDSNVTTIQGNTSNIAGTVWNALISSYTTNGTYGFNILRADAANKVGDVTLASSGGINRVDADVHAIVNNAAAATVFKNVLIGIGGSITASFVGNLSGSVGSVTNPVAVSTTSMSGIANTVWTNASRTITGGAVTSVTNPVSVTTTSMSGIAGTVWTYTPRTVTSGAGITAGDVWTYQIDAITTSGTAAAQLNDAAVSGSVVTIVNGPYRVTSTAEGTDGVIDILADSIQPITIYCINGFGQPFNIGGYTASVDIYDEAGGFVRSYTPTIDYALGGILTFNIDADITAVIGRYTLVVSLTDSDVIQLGPLTILVRPL